ncbi:hypothetical protein ITP53_39210 [Nonomuraea sp. K274]|uniref:Uncharacterized protein n=1 Tax=Nonomuraea cypriaca TaxID=1187855 RepID=A0A931AGM7_9ACTN|nr:hypothetical protein [Nonomuraea cypriaca]MBF8191623.1 hypothetical protein [Nonomuraea cypriaca]
MTSRGEVEVDAEVGVVGVGGEGDLVGGVDMPRLRAAEEPPAPDSCRVGGGRCRMTSEPKVPEA